MRTVAVLFARADSIYKTLPGCDVWDIDRDARKWPAPDGDAVIAHPPCRGWGRLRQFSYATEDERQLARDAVSYVRRHGGVLEHPAESTLWSDMCLPRPGQFPDKFGGYSIAVDQFVFGHRAEKSTWLYVVGCEPDDIPEMPIRGGSPTHCVRPTKSYPRMPSITKREREATPPSFAVWLVELARRTTVEMEAA